VTWLPPDPTIPAFPPAIPRGYPRRVARDNCPRSGPPPSRAHTPQMRQRHLPVGHTRQRAVVSDTLAAAPARPRAHPAPPAPAGLALAVVCASSGKARRRLSASLPPMPPAHIGTGILCNACFHAAASCRAYRTTRIPWITRPPSALGRPPPTLDHDPAAGWITPWLPVKGIPAVCCAMHALAPAWTGQLRWFRSAGPAVGTSGETARGANELARNLVPLWR
jgi:hypothetical protein